MNWDKIPGSEVWEYGSDRVLARIYKHGFVSYHLYIYDEIHEVVNWEASSTLERAKFRCETLIFLNKDQSKEE